MAGGSPADVSRTALLRDPSQWDAVLPSSHSNRRFAASQRLGYDCRSFTCRSHGFKPLMVKRGPFIQQGIPRLHAVSLYGCSSRETQTYVNCESCLCGRMVFAIRQRFIRKRFAQGVEPDRMSTTNGSRLTHHYRQLLQRLRHGAWVPASELTSGDTVKTNAMRLGWIEC